MDEWGRGNVGVKAGDVIAMGDGTVDSESSSCSVPWQKSEDSSVACENLASGEEETVKLAGKAATDSSKRSGTAIAGLSSAEVKQGL